MTRQRFLTPVPNERRSSRVRRDAPVELEVRLARRRGEIVRCQYLIADTYNRYYDIVFSGDSVDLNAKIEPYPHKYVMGLIGGELVAAAGLYLHDTYVQRFGRVTDEEIRAILGEAGVSDRYPTYSLREYTKLVVKSGWEGLGIGRFFFAVTHSKDFLNCDKAQHPLVLSCARASVYRGLYDVAGVGTRPVKPFPIYRVHEYYSSPADPMDSRVVIPDVDIEPRWYNLSLPCTLTVEPLGDRR